MLVLKEVYICAVAGTVKRSTLLLALSMQVPVSLRPVKRKHILLPITLPTYKSFFKQNEILGMRLKHIKPISLI